MKGLKLWLQTKKKVLLFPLLPKNHVKIYFLLAIMISGLLFSYQNVSAVTFSNIRGSAVKSITFNTRNPNTNPTLTLLNSSVTTMQEVITPASSQTRFTNLTFTLQNSLTARQNDKFRARFVIQVTHSFSSVYAYEPFYTANCPQGSSGKYVDTCTITQVDKQTASTLFSQGVTSQTWNVENVSVEYYVIDLQGHFSSASSVDSINFIGVFLSIYNPSSYSLSSYYSIFVDQFNIYTEVPDDDAAAQELEDMNQKDEQDRDNLENQQTTTESSADSSQASVESASSSIISNISSIMGALSTAPSNCKINVDTGNLQLTNINLCSVPTEIRSLINNVMVLIVTVSVFLCSYSLIRQFLNIYESFLAGGKS